MDEPDRPRRTPAAPRRRAAKKGSLLRELPVLLVVAFLLALVVKTFFVQAFFIPSGSMEQTLHGCPGCTGDRVLVNKVPYWFGEPEPGDVVVFKGPDTWTPGGRRSPSRATGSPAACCGWAAPWASPRPSEDDFVKRVIAVGGQTVAVLRRRGPGHRRRRAARRALHLRGHPDRAAGLRPGDRARGPAVGDGRPPLGVVGLQGRTSATSTPAPSGWTTSSARRRSVWPLGRFGLVGSPDIQDVEASGCRRAGAAPRACAPTCSPRRRWGSPAPSPVVAWRRAGAVAVPPDDSDRAVPTARSASSGRHSANGAAVPTAHSTMPA